MKLKELGIRVARAARSDFAVGIVAVLFLSTMAWGQPAPSAWPLRGNGPQGTKVGIGLGPAAVPGVKWKRSVGGQSSPVIATNGDVVCGTGTGIVRYSANGDLVWRRDLGFETYATPAIAADGSVYFAALYNETSGRGIFSLTDDGKTRWEYHPTAFGARTLSSPTIGPDGNIYFAVANDGVYAFHPDGSVAWHKSTAKYYVASPALSADGSTLYVADVGDRVEALNVFDGSTRWLRSTKSRSSPAVASDGTIYLGTDDGSVLALNADGSKKWEKFFGGSFNDFFMSPAIAPDGTVVIGSTDFTLYGLNPDGTTRWSRANSCWTSSPALDAAGSIFLTHDTLLSSYAIDGTLRWQMNIAGEAPGQTILDGTGGLYLITGGPTGGQQLWAVPEPGSLAIVAALFALCVRRKSRVRHGG